MSKPMNGLTADLVSGAADGKAVAGWRNDLVQNAAEGRKRDAYLGIDVGSISTKGVILNDKKEILASAYIWTEGNPIGAVKQLVSLLEQQFDKTSYRVVATGTTGSARRLAGTITGATMVKMRSPPMRSARHPFTRKHVRSWKSAARIRRLSL